ncbi:MAG TPA: TadE family protein [Abditibacterium sp.]|jgi:Flp pilus assembly protein TadG
MRTNFSTCLRKAPRHKAPQHKARRRGAALVEFAMIAVLFFSMLLGLIQFGLYQSTTNTLWNLSREGARFATVSNPSTAAIESHIRTVAPPNIDANSLIITVTPDARQSGQSVTVKLKYDLANKIIFPVVGALLQRPDPDTKEMGYKYVTSTTMRVE